MLLEKWNKAINLVSAASLVDVSRRHFLDSAQLFALASAEAKSWVDLGSGGGFPGVVIAILASSVRPDLVVTLIEADSRKAEFLRTVSRETGLAVEVRAVRIEACPPLDADIVSARALAPLASLCAYAHRHLGGNGRCLFMKGARHVEEVENARKSWAFDLEIIPSRSGPDARILQLKNLKRV
jgi:16S rRNA (guanine527-N7)-methyltransferase